MGKFKYCNAINDWNTKTIRIKINLFFLIKTSNYTIKYNLQY